MTNAEKIRSMTDEELSISLMCPAEYDTSFNKAKECCCDMNENCCECTLRWLQSDIK